MGLLAFLDKLLTAINLLLGIHTKQQAEREQERHQEAVRRVEDNPGKAMEDHFNGRKDDK